VYAVGNPLGNFVISVTQWIISGLDREVETDKGTMKLMQIDAAINPGNSGGGLFNDEGELIGLVNAKNTGIEVEGMGFAIPIDTVLGVLHKIEDKAKIDTGV
jgi:serine protease Do